MLYNTVVRTGVLTVNHCCYPIQGECQQVLCAIMALIGKASPPAQVYAVVNGAEVDRGVLGDADRHGILTACELAGQCVLLAVLRCRESAIGAGIDGIFCYAHSG